MVLAAALTKSIELALCIQFPYLRQPLGPLSILSALTTVYYGTCVLTDEPCSFESCVSLDTTLKQMCTVLHNEAHKQCSAIVM